GAGELTPIDTMTDRDGVAEADFYSPREPGISRVRAEAGMLAAELDIETALVDPGLPGGTITNYPNPFHPGEGATTIAYKLAEPANVTLRIFTLSGGLVLREDFRSGTPGGMPGLNEFEWDGRNGNGGYVSSGGYIVLVEAEGRGETLHVMRRRVGVVR
ncbi:MAG: FlgD immunoglobulin-like domain containing protein, partial [Candidatus Krumholzibacteria bacterium]|nr:FlgD immunoglobulin-like domain containing protein [Candidatus Krumholzibacteria bacterium]